MESTPPREICMLGMTETLCSWFYKWHFFFTMVPTISYDPTYEITEEWPSSRQTQMERTVLNTNALVTHRFTSENQVPFSAHESALFRSVTSFNFNYEIFGPKTLPTSRCCTLMMTRFQLLSCSSSLPPWQCFWASPLMSYLGENKFKPLPSERRLICC